MSIITRFLRFLKGILLFFIGKAEEQAPEAVLAAEVDNYNKAVSEFNGGLSKQAGLVSLLKAQIKKGTDDLSALTQRIQSLQKIGDNTKAAALAVTWKNIQGQLAANQGQLATAEEAYQSLTRQRDAFAKKSQETIQSVKGKISDAKIAEAQTRLAEMVSNTTFNPDGSGLANLSAQLDERVANAQGKMRVATDAIASSPWALSEEEQKASEAAALAEFQASLNPVVAIPDPTAAPKA